MIMLRLRSLSMKILITAGPTREAIDPVRYLTNRSSGKMGYAMAHSAHEFGHEVTLVSGPTRLEIPPGVNYVPVLTALDMHHAVAKRAKDADVIICCAAVSDYRPAEIADQKIKKTGETLTLELIKNPDILADCRPVFGYEGVLVGFAAETENLEENARGKLIRKHCDLVVANDVSGSVGFDTDHNQVLLVYPEHSESLPMATKDELADAIIQHCMELAAARLELN